METETTTPEKPVTPPFAVGQKVSWIKTVQRGHGFNMSHREGTVVELGEFACLVKTRNGRKEWIRFSRLSGEKSGALTKLFDHLAGATAELSGEARP